MKEPGRKISAIGNAALKLTRIPSNSRIIRPLDESVISDPDLAFQMLRHFLEVLGVPSGTRAIFSVPAVATNASLKVLYDVAKRAKLGKIEFIERALLAAIGESTSANSNVGRTVVEIGAGSTDVAVTAESHVVYGRAVRIGGNQINEAIARYTRRTFNLLIGDQSAEQIKIQVGSVWKLDEKLTFDVKGRNLIEGIPKTTRITDGEVRETILECFAPIFQAISEVRERVPSAIFTGDSEDIIVLSGGGALVRGIESAIQYRIPVRVITRKDPISCVASSFGPLLNGNWKPSQPLFYPPR
jgi:rod shape-determining protein MreB